MVTLLKVVSLAIWLVMMLCLTGLGPSCLRFIIRWRRTMAGRKSISRVRQHMVCKPVAGLRVTC